MSRKRKIICAGQQHALDAFVTEIDLPHWDFVTAGGSDRAHAARSVDGVFLGLVLLDQEWSQAEELMAEFDHLLWIGVKLNDGIYPADIDYVVANYLYDYHELPVDSTKFAYALGHAYGMAQIRNSASRQRMGTSHSVGDPRIIDRSRSMQLVMRSVAKLAKVDLPVLILGESGTGKELAAHAIHQRSARCNGPLVTINCGAIPPTLIQSVLFGHEKGAFTGADKRQIGRIEAARGGTLLLDEIVALPYALQANLLRFLQEGTIERVGGVETLSIDARVLAASHIDLEDAVRAGIFREDLYYRLNVLPLKLPPLRERKEDIEPLAMYYFEKFREEQNAIVKGISRQALNAMRQFSWPGNVRDLKNRLLRAVIMCENDKIAPVDLGINLQSPGQDVMTLASHRARAEKRLIEACLVSTDNNISEASRRLGVSRVALYQLLGKHRIR